MSYSWDETIHDMGITPSYMARLSQSQIKLSITAKTREHDLILPNKAFNPSEEQSWSIWHVPDYRYPHRGPYRIDGM